MIDVRPVAICVADDGRPARSGVGAADKTAGPCRASRNENVVLTAAATPDFIRKIFVPPSEPAPAQVSNQVPPPEPSAKPKLKPKKKPRH